ncbi:alpha/beta fold hydrolase [Desulfatirhabdium butyrativorans]|uniref:alpha/beta fold hydrolase n=1 Tax=Desulfatirhabdium butyrativorans TaxID=340467 RepID=UPI0004116F48|nr:alpha/beta hydrolase [Desulfatirhabdium butyrativorans]
MPDISIGTESIYVHVSESASEKTLLLIHGSGGDHTHWPQNLLSETRIRVAAIDLPGHGKSGGSGRTSVEDYADVSEAVVARCGWTAVTVAGHSLGGAIALTIGLRGPRWLDGLVLVGTGARLRVAPAILEGLATNPDPLFSTMDAWAFGPNADRALRERFVQQMKAAGAPVVLGDFSACDRFDMMPHLSRITCRTLVVSAENDLLTPLKYGQYLQQTLPDARLEVIPGAGHMMGLEQPEIFGKAILRFMGLEAG